MKEEKALTRERETVSKMIVLYCTAYHTAQKDQLCDDCQDLEAYAHQRINRCPFGLGKPTCAKCPIHCYRADHREQIRQVMRYAGPRMLLHHPILALHHLRKSLRKPPARKPPVS